MSRPCSPSRPLASSFASCSPAPVGDLGRRTFARLAFAGIRALRNGAVRHVLHRDFRPVSIDLQRIRGQHTSGDIGAPLVSRFSCSRRGSADAADTRDWALAARESSRRLLGTMGTPRGDFAAAHHCFVGPRRASHKIDALDRYWRRKSLKIDLFTSALRANSLVWGDRRGSRYLGGCPDCLACDQADAVSAMSRRVGSTTQHQGASARHCRGACSGDDHGAFYRSIKLVITVLLGYTMMILPRALVSLRAGVAQTPVELEHARSLATVLRKPFEYHAPISVPGAPRGRRWCFLELLTS